MDILIISGFLGAGKTSFIKAMTKATGRQFVVVENEFGNINIDSKILSDENQNEMKIYELTEGCICCSMNMDFSLSVMTIANTLNPDYILVEPSGVAMPSRILESLKKISYENIGVLAPVVIVDAKNYREEKNFYPQYFNDQINSAGSVVLSKSENLNENDFKEIHDELEIKDDVNFPLEHYEKWPREKWLELLTKRADGKNYDNVSKKSDKDSENLESIALEKIKNSSPDEIIFKLEKLLSGNFGDIVRAKGFINSNNGVTAFNVVSGIYEITSAESVKTSGEAVIIGEKLSAEKINELVGGNLIIEDD
ncbi:MAG: GTP-binding protein [Synergistaceae bacterium]|nr:GTP-binding protein [Synergistaceae bacterium]